MDGGDQLALLLSALRTMRLVTNFTVASCAIFVWDYILTFRMEVDLVWRSKWSFMKGLYLFQRYLPFIDTTWLILYAQTGSRLTKVTCQKIYPSAAVLMMVGFATSELILTLRTWAVWDRNRRLTIILPILYGLFWGSTLVIVGIYVNSMTFGDPSNPGFPWCFLTHAPNKLLVYPWMLQTCWNTLMLVLMLVPTLRDYRSRGHRDGALMKVVYRDGVIYYLYLFVLSFINAVIFKTLPLQYQQLLIPMERVLHSMFASRVLLHIRAQKERTLPDTICISIS